MRHFFRRSIAWFVKYIVTPVDNVLATPICNFFLLFDLETKQPYPGPDPDHPFPVINNSPNSIPIKESFVGISVLASLFLLATDFIKLQSKKEKNSECFFFIEMLESAKFKKWLNQKWSKQASKIDDRLRTFKAAAYYYNPKLNALFLFRRRVWGWLTRNENYLQMTKSNVDKKYINEIIKEIYCLNVLYINENKKYIQWEVKEVNGNLFIQSREKESHAPVNKINDQTNLLAIRQNENRKIIKLIRNYFTFILDFMEARIDELAIASYIFWFFIFLSYFHAVVLLVAVLAPIAIVLTWWGVKLFGVIVDKLFEKVENKGVQKEALDKIERDRYLWEGIKFTIKIDELSSENIFCTNASLINAALERKITVAAELDTFKKEEIDKDLSGLTPEVITQLSYKLKANLLKVELSEDELVKLNEKTSAKKLFDEKLFDKKNLMVEALATQAWSTLKLSRDFLFVRIFFNDFIGGLFTISFGSWLSTSFLALIVTFTPGGLVISTAVTLALGVGYGVYKAFKAYKIQTKTLQERESKYKQYGLYTVDEVHQADPAYAEKMQKREVKLAERDEKRKQYGIDTYVGYLAQLQMMCKEGKMGMGISWTYTKKFCHVLGISFIKAGTGILYLKLAGLPLGVILIAIGIPAGAAVAVAATGAFVPMAILFVTGGAIFVVWNLIQNWFEKKEKHIDKLCTEIELIHSAEANELITKRLVANEFSATEGGAPNATLQANIRVATETTGVEEKAHQFSSSGSIFSYGCNADKIGPSAQNDQISAALMCEQAV